MNLNIPLNEGPRLPRPAADAPKRKLFKHLKDNDYVLQIDNTSLEVFNTCPRRAEYELLEARVPHAAPPLIYGSAIHAGLETYYKHCDTLEPEDLKQAYIQAALDDFEKVSYSSPMGEWRTPDRCIDTLIRYVNHYDNNENFKVIEQDDEKCVEIPFSLPLCEVSFDAPVRDDLFESTHPQYISTSVDDCVSEVFVDNVHVYWTGKIDLMVKMHDGVWVVDHKTSSILGPTFWANFELANQTRGYTWAAQQMFDQHITGLMANVIVGRKETKSGTHHALERQRFPYRQDQIDEWEVNTQYLVSDFLANIKRGYFAMSPAWCMGKFGKCPYHVACTLPPEQRQSMLDCDQFTDNTWSPLNK